MSEKLPLGGENGPNVMKRIHNGTSEDSLGHDPLEAARKVAGKLRQRNGGMVATWEAAQAIGDLIAYAEELREQVAFYERKVDKWAQSFDKGYNAAIEAAVAAVDDRLRVEAFGNWGPLERHRDALRRDAIEAIAALRKGGEQ